MLKGIDILAKAVSATLGPKGRTVIIGTSGYSPGKSFAHMAHSQDKALEDPRSRRTVSRWRNPSL